MNYSQLELFQDMNEYEENLFNRAKKLKNLAQNLYNNFQGVSKIPFEEALSKYCIMKIEVDIDQIKDADSEPTSPKVFIWKYSPIITFITSDGRETFLKKGESFNSSIGPKIIPKWINDYFTATYFSHGDFYRFTKQHFAMDLSSKIIDDEDFMRIVLNRLKDKELVIYLESKLFPIRNFNSIEAMEIDIVNRINNLFVSLKNRQKPNWYFLGQYDDFTKENTLLNELGENDSFHKQLSEDDGVTKYDTLFATYYNDFLFLNNAEFFYQEKFNSYGWDKNWILTPTIIDSEFRDIDETKLNLSREIYYYMKKGPNDKFFRGDILSPAQKINKIRLIELINMAERIKNEKNS